MRVLHVITGLNVGGAETMLARLLEQRGVAPNISPEVVTLTPPGPVARRLPADIPVHSLDMRPGVPSLPAALRLIRLMRRTRPDLVMAWMHHAQLATAFAVPFAGVRVPVIWNIRHSLSGFADEKFLTRMILRLQARLSGRPAAIIYNSHAAAREYAAFGFQARRAMVIPNGFDARALAPRGEARLALHQAFGIAPDATVFGMVARADPMKDVPNLVRAFAAARGEGMNAHLLLVGSGMARSATPLASLLAELPAGSWTASDHRSDVYHWLGGLDALVLSSAWGEGFPNIIGEAMLAGVPCIGTDVGDIRLLIGDCGIVVPPKNAAALSNALLRMASLDPQSRAALGEAGRRRVAADFPLSAIAGRYAALCRDTVASATASLERVLVEAKGRP